MNSMKLNLKNKEWKEFVIGDIFNVDKGVYLHSRNILKGNIPFVTAKSTQNGINGFIGNAMLFKGNAITIEKIKLTAFYQSHDFYCSHDVTVIENESLNKYNALFICQIINRNGVKYNYGRQAQMNVVKKEKIYLPINEKGKPDFKFMEAYVIQNEKRKLDNYENHVRKRLEVLKKHKVVEPIGEKEWGEFFIEEVAEIISGQDIYGSERIKGNTPYVSSTANNNGVGYFVGNNNTTKESGCLSVNRNGSVGYSFYHPYDALFSNDCRKLRLKNPNKHIGIFISRQITSQREKYGYGYKMGTARLKRQKIMLPANERNEIDYDYMENYIKQLEYKKLNQYLNKKVG